MEKKNITFVNGHCLVNDGQGCLLVDTGSPMSFSKSGEITLDGVRYRVPTTLVVCDADYVSRNVGTQVDGLIGMDLIGRSRVLIDYPHAELVFGYEGNAEGTNVSCGKIIGGLPSIGMTLNGKDVRMILDTGAPISYIKRRMTAGMTPTGKVEDFNPAFGNDRYEVDVYAYNVAIAGQEWTGEYGASPRLLDATLAVSRTDGVVGKQLLERFRVLLDGEKVFLA